MLHVVSFLAVCTFSTVAEQPSAFLVESMPTDMNLPSLPGTKTTVDALVTLVNASRTKLDITVMYWDLVTDSKKLSPTDYKKFVAKSGQDLYVNPFSQPI
jgi:hypothetical protein